MLSPKRFQFRFIGILLCAFISFNPATVHAEESSSSKFSVDISSAKIYLQMAKDATAGNMPDDTDWENLFNSSAYKAFLDETHWDKDEFKHNIKEAFAIVYDPAQKEICDSIVTMLNDITGLQDELPFYVSTALSIRNKLEEYTKMLSNIDMNGLIDNANTMALDLIPGKGANLQPQSSSIYFIVWDLECRALGDKLYLDVNTFFHNGIQAATEALAHEMHHFYLGPVFNTVYDKDVADGAVAALVRNMREGVADILNKKEMPLKELIPYGDGMLKIYNDDYFNSPEVLAELDSITCKYLDKEISDRKYFSKAYSCAHFDGHTTGDFMVFLIRDRLGIEAVIESVGDLDKFIDNYNRAAEQAGTYKFSDRFTNHIHTLSQASKRVPESK